MLQNVNSEICRFQLITPFADCTICIGLWNVVVQRSGDVRQISLLGATYVGLPYTIQTFFHERGMSASFPPQQIAHRKILPCPLCDSWVLNVDSHRTNEGSLSEMLSLIFDNTRRTAHRTYSFTIAILGSQLTTATLHSSQRFGARRKKKYPKVQNPVNCIILSLVVCLALHFTINKLNWARPLRHLTFAIHLPVIFMPRLLFLYYSLCVCIFLHAFKQLRVLTNKGNTLRCHSSPVMLHKQLYRSQHRHTRTTECAPAQEWF